MKLVLILLLLLASTQPLATITKPASSINSIEQLAKRYGISRSVLFRQISKESSWRWWIVGANGEVGLMQVKPSTASDIWSYQVSTDMLKDSLFNVETAVLYLIHLRKFFRALGFKPRQADELTWSAYNEGPGNTLSRHFSGKTLFRIIRAYREYYVSKSLPARLPRLPSLIRPSRYARSILESRH